MNWTWKLEVLETSRQTFCGFYFNLKMKASQIDLEKTRTFFPLWIWNVNWAKLKCPLQWLTAHIVI